MRPRNVLKIFSHSRGFAIHLGNHKISEADIEKGIRAFSQDLLIELDRELTGIFPAAASLLYYFIDSPYALNTDELTVILKEGCIEDRLVLDVIWFLLYYVVLGVRADGVTNYIYNFNYDLRVLQIRANRAGIGANYIINPAFWPALSVRTVDKVQ